MPCIAKKNKKKRNFDKISLKENCNSPTLLDEIKKLKKDNKKLKEEINKSNQLVEKAREKLDKVDNNSESVFIQKKSNNKEVLDVLAIKNKYLKFKYLGKLSEIKTNKVESAPIYNMINIDFSTFKTLKEKSS